MQTIIKEISVASRNGHTNTAELGRNGHSANNGHADLITLELPPTPRFAPSCLPGAPAPSAPVHPSSLPIPEGPSTAQSSVLRHPSVFRHRQIRLRRPAPQWRQPTSIVDVRDIGQ
jgi:hypothetical protein